MVFAETLLSYPYRKLTLTVHTDELIDDIEDIRTYIDDIPVLSKDCFKNYMEQLILIFVIFRAAWLKVNARLSLVLG